MPTRNISLTDALDAFVSERVTSGAYQNASEVVRAGLRALKAEEAQRAAKIAALNAAIQEGLDDLDAGRFVDVEVDDLSAFLDRLGVEVEAEVSAEEAAHAAE